MEDVLKAAAGIMVATMLAIILQKQGKEYVTLLVLAVSAMGVCISLHYLKPIFSFLTRLQDIADMDNAALKILLKSVGIALLNEICGAICSDSGNSSLGKTLNLLSTTVIIWLSLPILEGVMDLIIDVLEGL